MTPLPPLNQPDPLVGRTLAGGLRVLKRLGETSEGPLYRAEYPQPGPPVALIFLKPLRHPPEPSPAWAPISERLDWVHRASRIRHPNVARVHEVSETPEGMAYAVAEALTGDRLSEILPARGVLHFREAIDVCLQAAAGLSAAHEAGIVHGNISPSTILLAHAADGRRPVKLIGFTLASLAASSRGYASPERLDGQPADELNDIFGLGAVLHHLLTGAPPSGRLARSIPSAVRTVLRKALAVSPDRRFQTIGEFSDALERAAASRRRTRGVWARRTLVVRATAASLVVAAGLWIAWSGQQPVVAVAREDLETAASPPARPVATRARSARPDSVRVARGRADPGAPARAVPARPRPQPPAPRPKPTPASAPKPAPVALPKAAPAPLPKAAPAPPPKPVGARLGGAPAPAVPRTEARATPRSDTNVSVSRPTPSAAPRPDSSPQAAVSPFRRAHPWAAVPGGRFYFRSGCSLALRAPDLVYFRSEEEARATGRSPSPVPGCS